MTEEAGQTASQRTLVSRNQLADQIAELERRTVAFVKTRHERRSRSEDFEQKAASARAYPPRQPDCFLNWCASAKHGDSATTLGPYSRWLIAAHLLMKHSDHDLLASVLESDVSAAATERVFGIDGNPDRAITQANRYRTPRHGDDVGPVVTAILVRLNRLFEKSRGGKLEWEEFFEQAVPLARDTEVVGPEPIEWFEQWIRLGAGKPRRTGGGKALRGIDEPRSGPRGGEVLSGVLSLIAAPDSDLGLRRIVNVCAADLDRSTDQFALDVMACLDARRCPAEEGEPLRLRASNYVHVSLGAMASRKSVLQDLYQAFCLPTGRLEALDQRPMDLFEDLAPLRRALTVNRVVLIFTGWDNIAGTFGVLHEYLCNTHWSEFLRVLAQPDLSAWDADPKTPLAMEYALLVLSTRPAHALSPSVRFVRPTVKPRPDPRNSGVQVQLPEEAVMPSVAQVNAWERQARGGAEQQRLDAWRKLLAIVAWRMVAASVNGIRTSTLARCIDYWRMQFWAFDPWTSDDQFREQLVALLRTSLADGGTLQHVCDEDVEGLSSAQRSLELDRRPNLAPDENKIWVFMSLETRARFVSHWLEEERKAGLADPGICSWARVNFVLSEECLRQGNLQLRHQRPGAGNNPYAIRRIVQTIFHGLMSLELDPRVFASTSAQRQSFAGTTLPAESQGRYRYLYNLLYRHVVEGRAWNLSRAFARSDLKVELLTLFVDPSMGPRMLTETAQPDSLPLDDVGLSRIAAPLKSDPLLWSDLLEALGRAGCDLEGERGNDAVEWVLTKLPGDKASADFNALLPPRSSGDYYRIATTGIKLHLDWLGSGNNRDKIRHLCLGEMKRLGIDAELILRLKSNVVTSMKQILSDAGGQGAAGGIDTLLVELRIVLEELKNRVRSSTFEREAAYSVLLRYGEMILVDAGQWSAASTPTHEYINGLAEACSLCWVADNLRLDAGGLGDRQLHWPLVAARGMRQYLRACIALAQALTQWGGKCQEQSLMPMVIRLMEHVQNRLGVYTSHMSGFRREQVSMLLMESSRLRTWIYVEIGRARNGAVPDAERLWSLVDASSDLMQQAEQRLFSLGYQAVLVRRLCLERIELSAAISMLNRRFGGSRPEDRHVYDVKRHERLAGELQALLDAAGKGSAYWQREAIAQGKRRSRATRTVAAGPNS